MFFSKTFGYAVRGVLYLVLQDGNRVPIEEIATKLNVPRHFMGKVMKRLVKNGILDSTKGPHGGFSANEHTLKTKLVKFVEITDGLEQFEQCVLRLEKCNAVNPCPLHDRMMENRNMLWQMVTETSVDDLLTGDAPFLVKSLVSE